MRNKVVCDVMREEGGFAPRSGFADIYFNGEYFGEYAQHLVDFVILHLFYRVLRSYWVHWWAVVAHSSWTDCFQSSIWAALTLQKNSCYLRGTTHFATAAPVVLYFHLFFVRLYDWSWKDYQRSIEPALNLTSMFIFHAVTMFTLDADGPTNFHVWK